VIAYESDLREMRSLVADRVRAAGLPPGRTVDLVLAVSEVAANTLRHTPAGGTVRIWRTAREVICQVDDAGYITDPLAGRRAPDPDRNGGYGLWLVNKSCDLTEMRTSQEGTTTRLHMRLANGS
jgi:anti-sigma regulatory factor (Ser/Thr protein kinase)